MAACLKAETIFIEAFETYPKQTIRNHCFIYGPNGKQKLSVPVTKINGNHTLVKDIRISDILPWQKIHWRSIETAYNNSPFFLYYRDHFEDFFNASYDNLLEMNTEILNVILNILGVRTAVKFTEKFEILPGVPDLRYTAKNNPGLKGPILTAYEQPFSGRHGFLADLSILDLIFNLGPESTDYLNGIR